ncbi:MAG: hypothetical protein F4Y86_15055 [Gammaproteobacteria bacterium]|nr:hypothetical protein [Gammaproteobacteria bacterium]MYB37210.1 hypothetical protein [Gammaproteobacteria bacterium]
MTDFVLAMGAIFIVLLTPVLIIMLALLMRRTQQLRAPYSGLFTTMERAISRETDRILSALHFDVPRSRIHAGDVFWRVPDHWLWAETSDEATGLLCAIAARPGRARLRVIKAVDARVRDADKYLEDTLRQCLRERPSKVAIQRSSDKKTVLLDGREFIQHEASVRNLRRSDPDFHAAFDIAYDEYRHSLARLSVDELWETAYVSPSTKSRPWESYPDAVFIRASDVKEMRDVRKDFDKAHTLEFAGSRPSPYSESRRTPLTVREAELAHHVIVDAVLRPSRRRSRRIDVLLREMQYQREGMLRAFPAYAAALESAATERDASTAWFLGKRIANVPNRVLTAMGACMTDMERDFAAAGVSTCIEERVERQYNLALSFDWSFVSPFEARGVEATRPAPAYARTLGNRGFRRKMDALLGEEITKEVVRDYEDAIAARELRTRVANACREYGASLIESREETAAVEDGDTFRPSSGSKINRYNLFRQAVDDRVANVLCDRIQPETNDSQRNSPQAD